MAEVNKKTKQVEVTTTKDVTVVNLVLSEDEARTLSAILYSAVGGGGPVRDHSDTIVNALRKAGYRYHLNGVGRSADVDNTTVAKEYDDYFWSPKPIYDDYLYGSYGYKGYKDYGYGRKYRYNT